MHLWSASHCIYSPNRHSDAATRAAGRHRNEWGDNDNRLKTLFDAGACARCATRDRIEHQTILGQRTSLHPTGGRCAHRAYQRRNRSALGRAGSQSSAAHKWHRPKLNSRSSSHRSTCRRSASLRYGIPGGTSILLTVGSETACDWLPGVGGAWREPWPLARGRNMGLRTATAGGVAVVSAPSASCTGTQSDSAIDGSACGGPLTLSEGSRPGLLRGVHGELRG
jgi:hypothetical protein